MLILVYFLCSTASFFCAILLLRSYMHSKTRFLLWSALCFTGLTGSNILLFLDLVIVPYIDLSGPRTLINLFSMTILLFGLIWDSA